MRIRLIIDMNLSPAWVAYLTRASIRSRHWSTEGAANATDRQILLFAAEHRLIVLTHDLDFGAILAATGMRSPSVVQVRADNLSPDAIGPKIIATLMALESELESGALVTVEPGRSRVRLLPLR